MQHPSSSLNRMIGRHVPQTPSPSSSPSSPGRNEVGVARVDSRFWCDTCRRPVADGCLRHGHTVSYLRHLPVLARAAHPAS